MSRSPFPPSRPRARLRMSLEADEATSMQSANNHSPFQGLLRFSPRSPIAKSTKSSKQKFFSEAETPRKDGGNTELDGLDLDSLRSRANVNLTEHPSQAVFFASILYHKTFLVEDAILLARAHFFNQNYVGCLRVLDHSQAPQQDYPWVALLLGCQALAKTADWSTTEEILSNACSLETEASGDIRAPIEDDDFDSWQSLKDQIVETDSFSCHPLARLLWWRGKAQFELGDPNRATLFWKTSLKLDASLQASYSSLLDHHLLTSTEAHSLVTNLNLESHQWLHHIYLSQITMPPVDPRESEENSNPNKPHEASFVFGAPLDASSIQLSSPLQFNTPKVAESMTTVPREPDMKPSVQQDIDVAFNHVWNAYKLQHAPQVVEIAAVRAYRRCDWARALSHCQTLATTDPTMGGYIYVATLVTLGQSRALFQLAHEWVGANPQAAQSWFAVGAYYFACGRYHVAQRHFCKATRLDPSSVYSWIAFGCSFGACDESDQALASFRAAQRLSPGEHTALLYMGMEYVRTNHKVLANYFLQAALSTSGGGDPLCWHELGTLALQQNEYTTAIDWFSKALRSLAGSDSSIADCCSLLQDAYWEPTLFNLGHALRKTKQFTVAQDCFQACSRLVPSGSTFAAFGYTLHLQGKVDAAISVYHQALSYKADDAFVTTMLERALAEAISDLNLLPTVKVKCASSPLMPLKSPSAALNTSSSRRDDSIMSEGMDSDVDVSMS